MDSQLARVVELLPTLDLSNVAAIRARGTRMPVSPNDSRVVVTERMVPGPPGAPEVRVRIYQPPGHRAARRMTGAVVHFHPGLFFGSLDMDQARCMRFSAGAGCVVVSVDYRLAPEHPFPAAFEDGCAVLRWTAASAAELGVDPSQIAVAGCSTGATLAAAVALWSRDTRDPLLALQMLLYPALDDRLETMSMLEFAEPAPCEAGRAGSRHTWRHYLGETNGAVSPYAAPARAVDLAGLAPAYILTAEYDCLRDEGITHALRLLQAGVPVELHQYAGAFHAFDLIVRTAGISRRAVDEQVAVLRRALSPGAERPSGRPAASSRPARR
jgi:acetyl esterase/lipase